MCYIDITYYDNNGKILINIVKTVIWEGILSKIFLSIAPASVSSSSGKISPNATAESLTNSKYKMSPKVRSSMIVA